MTAAALISLRETFEASLVVCVMLAFLERSSRQNYTPALWSGVGAGVLFSILLAWVMQSYAATLGDEAKELYEGIMMLTAAGLLLWMIGWMAMSGRSMKANIEKNMAAHIAGGSAAGIFLLSFTSTAREGAEMVLLIHATLLSSSNIHALAGVGIGATAAIAMAALLLRGVRLVPIHLFFTLTSIFLLVLGMGLTMHGIGELQEAGTVTWLSAQAWDTSWLLRDHTFVADIAKIVIGYESTPSILQTLGGAAYILLAIATLKLIRAPRASRT
jgi:high-affinity iron transporter